MASVPRTAWRGRAGGALQRAGEDRGVASGIGQTLLASLDNESSL